MSFRIQTSSDADGTVLKVAGRLRSDDVDELTRVYRSASGTRSLDLSELLSADHAAVEILRELIRLGVPIHGASPYIELLLRPES